MYALSHEYIIRNLYQINYTFLPRPMKLIHKYMHTVTAMHTLHKLLCILEKMYACDCKGGTCMYGKIFSFLLPDDGEVNFWHQHKKISINHCYNTAVATTAFKTQIYSVEWFFFVQCIYCWHWQFLIRVVCSSTRQILCLMLLMLLQIIFS